MHVCLRVHVYVRVCVRAHARACGVHVFVLVSMLLTSVVWYSPWCESNIIPVTSTRSGPSPLHCLAKFLFFRKSLRSLWTVPSAGIIVNGISNVFSRWYYVLCT